MLRPRACVSLLLFGTFVTFADPTIATAQPAPASNSAVDLANEALRHFEAGTWSDALAKFQEAEARTHSPVFVVFMARSTRNLGRLLAARKLFATVANEAIATDAPDSWKDAIASAKRELGELEARIPTVTLTLTKPTQEPTLTTIDGAPAKLGVAQLLDPGAHVVVVRVGERVTTQRIEVPDRGAIAITIGAPTPTGTTSASSKVQAESTRGSILPGALLTAAGGAGLVAGIITGALALEKATTLHDRCEEGVCPASAREEIDEEVAAASDLGDVCTTTLVVGGALAVAGIVLLVVRPGGSPDEAPAVTLAPTAGGLLLWGRF